MICVPFESCDDLGVVLGHNIKTPMVPMYQQ